ncbi:hypothetical protein C8K36_102414 [Rhodococcus sp. OK519]|uniref:hypothetical protein n=1 Tax=Rhodococcus sp. OK519 TaxID=2135729 RepID=UPI000D4363F4|nr:hypothetical protein C8K36_102414 [Rhodococcus sp. OK519]
MRNTLLATARVTAVVVSGLACATFIGSGAAQADPADCGVRWDPFNATATCHDIDAPPGREYVLIVDCWGLHGIPNAFPFYAIGPYTQSSRSFVPTGEAAGACGTNWGAPSLNAGVITNAHVEIYRH